MCVLRLCIYFWGIIEVWNKVRFCQMSFLRFRRAKSAKREGRETQRKTMQCDNRSWKCVSCGNSVTLMRRKYSNKIYIDSFSFPFLIMLQWPTWGFIIGTFLCLPLCKIKQDQRTGGKMGKLSRPRERKKRLFWRHKSKGLVLWIWLCRCCNVKAREKGGSWDTAAAIWKTFGVAYKWPFLASRRCQAWS